MKDDQAGNAGRFSSLVERAARKIVAERGRQPPASTMPSVSTTSDRDSSAMPAPDFGITDAPTQFSESISHAPAAENAPWPGGAAKSDQGAQRRKSRMVSINIADLESRNLLTPGAKRSKMVEEFRLIKRRILRRRLDGDAPSNTIVVTSALPEEGKTTIAINLAMSIAAEEDLRVLLIDADFIRPQALRKLGISADKGLIDVIQDPRIDISDVMLATNIDKLSLIPSGQSHHRCTELLASGRMRDIIAEMASRYEDRILIFDSPPVLATTESVTLASHMGQILFVVEAERTRRQLVTSALELIGNHERVSMVLNCTRPRLGNTEFGSYYGAYYYANGAETEQRAVSADAG